MVTLVYAMNIAAAAPRDDTSQPNDWQERERERYRLRIGLRGTSADDWFFGVRLETSQSKRSTNVTFGDDTSTTSGRPPLQGPFAKNSDGINVGQAYLGYKGFRDITLTVGKMPNPLVTTLMVWDADINPEGMAEQWKHTFNFNFGGGLAQAEQSYTKDSKASPFPNLQSEPWTLKIDLFANFAQFVYDDANPENPLGRRRRVPAADAIQRPMPGCWRGRSARRFKFPKNFYFQVAPTLYNYTGNGDTFNVHFVGGDPSYELGFAGHQSSRHQQPARSSTCRRSSAGRSANCRCESSAISRSTSKRTIAPRRRSSR